jgi:hypothetical protein
MHIDASVGRARVFRFAIAVAVFALIAACGGDSRSPVAPGPPPPPPPPPAPPPPPPLPFLGNYTLVVFNDSVLPTLVPFPQFAHIRMDSGTMKLNNDSTYSMSFAGRDGYGAGNLVIPYDTGTFTESASDSTVAFTSKFLHGIVYTGVATDTSLAVGVQGSIVGSTVFTIPTFFLKDH